MRKVLALAVILGSTATAAFAGEISPGLERMMTGMKGSDEINVFVVLRDQAPVEALDQSLHAARVPRAERHRTVVDALREAAARSQGPSSRISPRGAPRVRSATSKRSGSSTRYR